MSHIFSDAHARMSSRRECLTAVMGPVPDHASAREQSGVTARLNATAFAGLTEHEDISRLISLACSQEGELNHFFQDKINASRDEFAARALAGG